MTTETIRGAVLPVVAGLEDILQGFLSACSAGTRAAHDWERLNAMPDSELARRGLTRGELGRAVFERNFR